MANEFNDAVAVTGAVEVPGPLSKLNAINAMLGTINEWPVPSLDTGGTSMAAQAERVLDLYDKLIQGQDWHENREYDVELDAADVTKVATVIAAGTWDATALTLTDTNAFAAYGFEPGDQISVTGGTGVTASWYAIKSKTSDSVIVLKESIASANNADTVTDIIGWENAVSLPDDCLKADSYGSDAWRDVCFRNGMLFDRDDNTFSFTDVPKLIITRQLGFGNLSLALQNRIMAEASKIFQRREVGGKVQDAFLRQAVDSFYENRSLVGEMSFALNIGVSK